MNISTTGAEPKNYLVLADVSYIYIDHENQSNGLL